MQVVLVSISSAFYAVHSWNVCGSHKSRKKSMKTPILGFKIVQGHRCWYPRKARQQCLLWCAAGLSLSTTVLLLDWTTLAETARFEGGTRIWCILYGELLEPRGQTLHRWYLRLMANIPYAGEIETPGLHHMIAWTLEYLVYYEVIWCHWVRRFPSNEGLKEGYPP